jgi:hypothetical protein
LFPFRAAEAGLDAIAEVGAAVFAEAAEVVGDTAEGGAFGGVAGAAGVEEKDAVDGEVLGGELAGHFEGDIAAEGIAGEAEGAARLAGLDVFDEEGGEVFEGVWHAGEVAVDAGEGEAEDGLVVAELSGEGVEAEGLAVHAGETEEGRT